MAFLNETGLTHYDAKIKEFMAPFAPLYVKLTVGSVGATSFSCSTSCNVQEIYNAHLAGRVVILKTTRSDIPSMTLTYCAPNIFNSGCYDICFTGSSIEHQYYVSWSAGIPSSSIPVGSIDSCGLVHGNYIFFGSDIVAAGLSTNSPYTASKSDRGIILKNNKLKAPVGSTMTITATGSSTYNVAAWFVTSTGASEISSGSKLTGYVDTTWLDSGATYTVPDHEFFWVNLRQTDDADFDVTDITRVKITCT